MFLHPAPLIFGFRTAGYLITLIQGGSFILMNVLEPCPGFICFVSTSIQSEGSVCLVTAHHQGRCPYRNCVKIWAAICDAAHLLKWHQLRHIHSLGARNTSGESSH